MPTFVYDDEQRIGGCCNDFWFAAFSTIPIYSLINNWKETNL